MKTLLQTIVVALLLSSSPMYAALAEQAALESPLAQLQKGWAIANYQLQGDSQEEAFEKLIEQADASALSAPGDAELQVWAGIIKSTFAGIKSGLGALSYAKAARENLEQSLQIDDHALNGSAYTTLGTLYNKVPGWPIGFGDKKKSEKFLKKALEINAGSIDANYFYADYLMSRKNYALAKTYFEKAKMAAPRAARPLADQGRRKEIEIALSKIQKRL